jgi:peptidoglycan hydrolase-like protein with peptidoglycan-binding domain
MTAATIAQSFAHLPLQVGGVALTQAGRGALWVISRYMRSPLTNSAIAALVVTTAMAGSNALYGQRHMHPSPLFVPFEATQTVEPVVPAVKPKGLGTKPLVVGTPKKLDKLVVANPPASPIGNADVSEVQKKLAAMTFFTGTIDGYYGPQTAKAIRKFEESQGLKLTGELTPEIVQKIKNAPLASVKPSPVAPKPAAEPAALAVEEKPSATVTLPAIVAPKLEIQLPETKPAADAEATVAPQSLAALVEPAPLTAEITTGSIGTPKKKGATVLGRPLPATPGEALEMAADTAGEAIDTIIAGVQTVAMNRPGEATPFAAEGESLTTGSVAEASPDNPQVGIPLKIDEEPAKPGTQIAVLDTPATPDQIAPVSVNDPVTVAKVQRGLGSLGFLHGPADGVAGEATAKAIRNFEVYFNYKVTGRISPELLDLLVQNGASI